MKVCCVVKALKVFLLLAFVTNTRAKTGEVCFLFGSVESTVKLLKQINQESILPQSATQERPGRIGPRGPPGMTGDVGQPGPAGACSCNVTDEVRRLKGKIITKFGLNTR